MDEHVDTKWNARTRVAGRIIAGVALGAALVACGGRDMSVDPSRSCGGSDCDAGGDVIPDAGTPANDASSGDAGAQDDGAVSTHDAAADANAPQVSDPCPSGPIAFNCSTTCGAGTGGDCSLVSCNPDRIANDKYLAHVTLPAVLRTPEKPGVDPMCTMSCEDRGSQGPPSDKAHRAFAMAVVIDGFPPDLFRVRVDPPWWIERNGLNTPTFCPLPSSSKGDDEIVQTCAIGVKGFDVLIWTDDPNAPARNVYIDAVPQGTTCN